MTQTKNRMAKRIISLTLAVLTLILLVFSLSSCSGGSVETIDAYGKEEKDFDFVARVVAIDENYKLRLAAAANGYDISAEDFVDPEVLPENPTANITAAKKVLSDAASVTNFYSESDKNAYEAYVNALDAASLKAVLDSKNFNTAYELSDSDGFFLLIWIGKFLGFLTNLVGNYYVISILIFAVLVELIMLPMSVKQQKNTIGMAKLRPLIAKIEKKYAGRYDQVTVRKKQEEIMQLQQKSGYSPMSGCLPLLLQLIVVGFILYPIIQNPLSYVLDQSSSFSSALLAYATSPVAAGGLGLSISGGNVMELLAALNEANIAGIKDFALIANGEEVLARYMELVPDMPNFTAFGINLGKLPSFASILILIPIFNVLGQWVSMFLTRRWNNTGYNMMGAQDAQGKFSIKMMDVLPLLITVFILFQVPAMIGVYWFFRSLISLGKQFIMQKVLPVPKFTEAEIRELEKAEKERQKAQKEALKQQPKFRSLHYIDEDDYDELPTVKNNNTSGAKLNSQDAPEIKD